MVCCRVIFCLNLELYFAVMLLDSRRHYLGINCNNFHLPQLQPKCCCKSHCFQLTAIINTFFFYALLSPVFVAISRIACMSHKRLVNLVTILVFCCSYLSVLLRVW